ncbi:MAG: hypothetical protein JXA96_10080 [Sedimentisphaerales bacterium]|nr:hypothetical protein [Sedimentisphaerales bacterium]
MKKLLISLLALSNFFLTSCALQQKEVDSWLVSISKNIPAEIDISGKWYDAEGSYLFGWGEGYLKQEQNKVSGIIGSYNIKGIVSGKQVYLVFMYGGSVCYTARLEMVNNLLAGSYFEANDRKQKKGYTIMFTKKVDTTN